MQQSRSLLGEEDDRLPGFEVVLLIEIIPAADLHHKVVKLDRVFFAGLTKKNVRRGDWRFLTEKEVSMLRMGAFE